ncbi:MAG: calcium/sodium antiporter [Planctomycetota bacterium]
MPDWILIAIGLTALIASGEALVRGASWLAMASGVRPMVVGATVVAFGTSAPELAASIVALFEDSGGIATGTVFGSNIANVALIVGLVSIYRPIDHVPGSARFEVRCLMAVTLLTPVPLLLSGTVTRLDGALLLAFLIWFSRALVRRELRDRRQREADPEVRPTGKGVAAHTALLTVGLAGLPFGADWLVTGARGLAQAAGLRDQVIGLTVVALGTSLPELATSWSAARRGHSEIALGNILGSNLFNICMVLGAAAVATPIHMTWQAEGPLIVVGIAVTIVLAILLGLARGIGRLAGTLLFAGYVAFMAWSVWRG